MKSKSRQTDIARIVGRACRLPGSPTVSDFWSVLSAGANAVGSIGDDRFCVARHFDPMPGVAGKSYTFAAGCIDDVWGFDCAAFAMTPREALLLDPQQRLLLEVASDALDDAGLTPATLSQRNIGVYVGGSSLDHGTQKVLDLAGTDAHTMTGNTLSLLANRLSYAFDLTGPSMTIDTACSSGLVALNEACQAIREGRIEGAIVAGVNLLLSPLPFVGFSAAGMLSPDGLCRPFDARGQGYVRAEGAVAFLLLGSNSSLAPIREHARILASGVNSDGRTTGVALPAAAAQADLLAGIYSDNKIDPESLAFIEAHGTGTPIGDPAEANALGQALGRKRSAPLPIGSAKSNIGHTEPVAGLVGVLKAMLALENRILPATSGFEEPNPDIPFADLNLIVSGQPIALNGGAPNAGVSAFGFGGTNSHAVITVPQVPGDLEKAATAFPPKAMMISAACEEALRALSASHARDLQSADNIALHRLASSLPRQRVVRSERLIVPVDDPGTVRQQLEAYAQTGDADGLVRATSAGERLPVAFVYSGNGAHWPGMGLAAYQRDQNFRSAFDAFDKEFSAIAGWSPVNALEDPDLDERLADTSTAQPLLAGIQIALTAALVEYGLRPSMVLGHSAGEVAAAHACGALDLAQTAQLVHHRSRRQEALRDLGAMAVVLAHEHTAQSLISGTPVEIAAINSPRAVTISGPADALAEIQAQARSRGIAFKRMNLNYPFHSSALDPHRDVIFGDLQDIRPAAGEIPFIPSSGTESAIRLDADYWWRNIREPVQFMRAVRDAHGRGARLFLEIGPQPTLTGFIRGSLADELPRDAVIASLDKKDSASKANPVWSTFARALARGADIDTDEVFGPAPDTVVAAPAYPWQRRYLRQDDTVEALNPESKENPHPLLGWQVKTDIPEWRANLSPRMPAFLADHQVGGLPIFPGAGFADMALAAACFGHKTQAMELLELDILDPLILPDEGTRTVRTCLSINEGTVEISSRPHLSRDPWQLHARGRVAQMPEGANAAVPANVADNVPGEDSGQLYRVAARAGLDYGPAFRRLEMIHRAGNEIHVRLSPTALTTDVHILDPTSLDSVFHALFRLYDIADIEPGRAFVPIRFAGLRIFGRSPAREARITVIKADNRNVLAAVTLFDGDGLPIAHLSQARFRAARLGQMALSMSQTAYHYESAPISIAGSDQPAPACDLASVARQCLTGGADETSLLWEAGAQRAIYDAFANNMPTGEFDPHETWHNPDDLTRVICCLQILQRIDLAKTSPDGRWTLSRDCNLPALNSIISQVLRDRPDQLAQAQLLARAGELLSDAVAGRPQADGPAYSSALLEHSLTTSAASQTVLDGMIGAVKTALAACKKDRILRVLLLGSAHTQLIRKISQLLGERGFIKVADADSRRLKRMEATIGADNAPPTILLDSAEAIRGHERFDLVLCCDELHTMADPFQVLTQARSLLTQQGMLFVGEAAPNDFDDLVRGASKEWFTQSTSPYFPLGARRWPAEWNDLADRTGFEAIEQVEDAHAAFLFAKAGNQIAADNSEPDAAPRVAIHWSTDMVGDPLYREFQARFTATTDRPSDQHANGVNGNGAFPEQYADATDILAYFAVPSEADNDAAIVCERVASLRDLANGIPERDTSTKLWLILPCGAPLSESAGSPSQVALWAAARTLRNEYPHIDIRTIDASPDLSANKVADKIAALIADPGDEVELQLTSTGRRAVRIRRGLPAKSPSESSPAARLVQTEISGLDGLHWQADIARAPEPDEVQIKIQASGLNFRDVMWALGLLPDEALEEGMTGPVFGFECAGRIARAGDAVRDLKQGDPVIAIAPAAFASHATVSRNLVARLPQGMDIHAAASLPVAFITVHYALNHLARLAAGEWLLIHGGAGAVGLAALQAAKAVGARTIVTAGSPEKRAFLRALGADHVFSSRSLTFVDEIAAIAPEGIDVILNALAGEPMERSLDLLAPFGRFCELGKRDYYANTRVGLRPFRRNISYFGIDADQLMVRRPQLARQLMAELSDHLHKGDFAPLPYRRFEASEVASACRLMQNSGHVGKIVVTPPDPRQAEPAHPMRRLQADPDKIYLIVGGYGGFGLETAFWLAEHGATRLVLAGRSGKPSDAANTRIEDLKQLGVTVSVVACDVADKTAVEQLLDGLRAQAPLGGIVHSAMVLDDKPLRDLTDEQISTIIAPKIAGAENLDRLAREKTVEFLILYSSVSALIGNPGQAPYVAANAYLEALAHRRRSEGLPALAVGWGAISDAGYLARTGESADIIAQRTGAIPMKTADALGILARLLTAESPPAVTIAPMDWSRAVGGLPVMATPTFAILKRSAETAVTAGQQIDLHSLIGDLTDEAASKEIAKLLAAEIAQIFRMPVDDLNLDRPLVEVGMDSLMGLELKMTAQRRFGIELPISSVSERLTIRDLAARVVASLRGNNLVLSDVERSLVEAHSDADLSPDADIVEKVRQRSEDYEGGRKQL